MNTRAAGWLTDKPLTQEHAHKRIGWCIARGDANGAAHWTRRLVQLCRQSRLADLKRRDSCRGK